MINETTSQKHDKKILALAEAKRYERILAIAKSEVYGLHTLDARHNDDADFYSIAVWSLKNMLEKAYEAGYEESLYEQARNDALA